MRPDTQLDLTPPETDDLTEVAPELAPADLPPPDAVTPRLEGELVVAHGDEVRAALLALLDGAGETDGGGAGAEAAGEGAPEPIDLDLSGVTAIDTAGLQLLLSARRSAERRQRLLRFVSPSEPVRHVLELAGGMR